MISVNAHTFRFVHVAIAFLRMQIRYAVLCSLAVLGFAGSTFAQQPIEISEPKVPAGAVFLTQGAVDLSVKVNNAEVKKLRVLVSQINEAKEVLDNARQEFTVDSNQVAQPISVNVFKDQNIIKLIGLKENFEAVANATVSLTVTCTGKKCAGAPQTGGGGGGGITPVGGGGGGGGSQSENVTIKTDAITAGAVSTYFVVKKDSKITKLDVTVYGPNKTIVDSKSPLPLVQVGDTLIANASLKVVAGKNRIQVFDVDKQTEKANWALAEVTCTPNPPAVTCSSAPSGPKPAQAGLLHIISPEKKAEPANVYNEKTVPLKVKLDAGSATTKLKVKVINNDVVVPQKPDTFEVPADAGPREKTIDLKIGKGLNKITVVDSDNETAQLDYVEINCEGEGCGIAAADAQISVAVPLEKVGNAYPVKDKSTVDAMVTVAKGDIKKIQYDVFSAGKSIHTSDPISVDATEKEQKVPLLIKFVRGLNEIKIYDPTPGSKAATSILIDCTGDCASDLNIATVVTASQNARVLVGLEQVGGSSAESKSNPFLDFFFMTPVWFNRRASDVVTVTRVDAFGKPMLDASGAPIKVNVLRTGEQRQLARFGFWGNVRLTASPEQLTATGVLPSTLANQVAQSGTSNLVQSFDFLAGVEGRLLDANGTFLSFLPGIRQRTIFSLAAGYGAISPLDTTRENTKFFLIPGVNSSQRAEFERRFGKPAERMVNNMPVTPTHVAFVPLERDRFFRQWFAGIRLKTFYCDGEDENCDRFRNSFPAITDFMIGQSQAVTGGSFKRTTAEGKTKQSFVFKVDAFYPLPFREARFIYLHGTAIMKIGGDVRVDLPLILDPATSIPNINDPLVYIPAIDFMRGQQPNRDYYKIGVGINLTDFFNRNKPR